MQRKALREARLKVRSPGGRGWETTWTKGEEEIVWEVKSTVLDHMAERMEGKEKIINDTDSGLADLIDDGGINWGREHRRKNRYRRNEEFRLDFTAFVAGPEHPQGNTWVRSINLELREKKGRIQFWEWSGCFNWALPLPRAPYFLYAIALVLHCNLQTTAPPPSSKTLRSFEAHTIRWYHCYRSLL